MKPAGKRQSEIMKSKYRRWTKEEDDLLRKLYPRLDYKELGGIFNRPPLKVCRRAWRLGIKKPKHIANIHVSVALRAKKMDHRGENNGRWKGGKHKTGDGYIMIYAPNHPYAYRNKMLEHRLVLERQVERYLLPDEHVHHINGIKSDNRPDNLVLVTHSEHRKKYHLEESLLNLSKTPSHQKHYESHSL